MHIKLSLLLNHTLLDVTGPTILALPVTDMLSLRTTQSGRGILNAEPELANTFNDLRRTYSHQTGSITFPNTWCTCTVPEQLLVDYIMVGVQPKPTQWVNAETKIATLYKTYRNMFDLTNIKGSETLVIALEGVDSRYYDLDLLLYALISCVVDTKPENTSIKEVCIVTNNVDHVTKSIESIYSVLGLLYWYTRLTPDMTIGL